MTNIVWDLERIRLHIAEQLPLGAILGITIDAAEAGLGRVRLAGSDGMTRPGGSVAGPVLFAMADMASYLPTLIRLQADVAMTSSLMINFLRPAMSVPIIAEAVPLREGRIQMIYDVRLWSEVDGPTRLVAQATATWAVARHRTEESKKGEIL